MRRKLLVGVAVTAVCGVLAGIGGYAGYRALSDRPSAGPGAPATSATPASPSPSVTGTPSPSATRSPKPSVTTPGPPAPPPKPPATTPAIPSRLLGQDIERIPTQRKIVALTFDAGANPDGLPSILATLRREKVPATFFLTGEFARAYPQQSRTVVADGHRVANHSDTHPHFPPLSDTALRAQVRDAQRSISGVTGRNPQPFFRFPYGDRDTRTIRAVNQLGYVAVRWTVDTLGWQGTTGGRSVDSVVGRVVGALRPGEIVLLHVGSHPGDRSTLDADALPRIISELRERGYQFVTLDALL